MIKKYILKAEPWAIRAHDFNGKYVKSFDLLFGSINMVEEIEDAKLFTKKQAKEWVKKYTVDVSLGLTTKRPMFKIEVMPREVIKKLRAAKKALPVIRFKMNEVTRMPRSVLMVSPDKVGNEFYYWVQSRYNVVVSHEDAKKIARTMTSNANILEDPDKCIQRLLQAAIQHCVRNQTLEYRMRT